MTPAPVTERVSSVDALRGMSLLGILTMNILGFSLPGAVTYNPTVMDGDSGVNLWTWFAVDVLFEGKMRALFSMLFGASMILMTSRSEARGGDARIADIWLRRCLWLMFIASLHAWFLWDGDILFSYALAGLFLYPFRKLASTGLLIAGLSALSMQLPKAWVEYNDARVQKLEWDIAREVENTKLPLTSELQQGKEDWEERVKANKPADEELQKIVKRFRSGYGEIFRERAARVPGLHSLSFYTFVFADSFGMMLIGMSLCKWEILSARRSARFYIVLLLIGYGIGLPVRVAACLNQYYAGFDVFSALQFQFTYEITRLLTAAGHLSVLMLVCRAGIFQKLTRALSCVGQTALTNYLLQSVLCTTLFYGYGFGWFGKLERYQLYYVVGVIWLLQLVFSSLWLSRFRFGPVEWAWRSLTYWERQPLRSKTVLS
ncbi:MAG: DUF418 domain-containing protein [Candidatus Solibacter usitatus]|nr:DUF418 domain-containing protein [Candidatus Solibacter usitatus]